jgi:AraC-like DNA-binding protein
MVNEPHRHFTTSILFGLDGPIRVKAGASADFQPLNGVVVAPNVEQQLDARGVRLVALQVDPESEAYARIAHLVAGASVHVLPSDVVDRLRAAFQDLDGTAAAFLRAWETTLRELGRGDAGRRVLDSRVRRVLALIKEDFLSPPPAARLAAAVDLSPGRLIHLFTREMGLPIRRYVLWLRLRDVIISLVAGTTLTEAAHRAGFSDSAHLSRTFRGMFGFPPSLIADGRGRVRLGFAPDPTLFEDSPHPPIDAERLARAAPRASGS